MATGLSARFSTMGGSEPVLRLRYAVRATWHAKPRSIAARLRLFWHDFIVHAALNRGGERCQDCGRSYILWWTHHPDLWEPIVGCHAGLLCPACFSRRADEKGLLLRWRPEVI